MWPKGRSLPMSVLEETGGSVWPKHAAKACGQAVMLDVTWCARVRFDVAMEDILASTA